MSVSRFTSSPDVPVLERPPKRAHLQLVANDDPDLARLKSALDAIPNSGADELDYDLWRNVVFAVHFATDGSDAGLALAHEFSARSSKYDADFLDTRTWPYIDNDRAGAVVTERTIFNMAEKAGWQDPATLADFDVVPPDPPATGGRFTFLQAADFAKGERRRWWVKHVIPAGEIVVVYGASGSGKSFWTFDVGAAVARGIPWRGRITKRGRVAYIFAEGAGGAKDRLAAYAEHHNIGLSDLDVYALGAAPNLMAAGDVKELIADLRQLGPLALVVCDTYAQMTAGADENSGEHMSKAIANGKAIHAATGATVLLVAHSGKDASKGIRGWSGIKGALDAEIEIVRDDNNRIATVTKMKDGAGEGDEYGFRLSTVPVGVDEEGDIVSSCIVEHVTAQPKALRRPEVTHRGANQRRVLRAIQELSGLDGEHPTLHAVLEAVKEMMVFDAEPGKKDRRRELALKALDALVEAGKVEKIGDRVRLHEPDRA